MTEVAVLVKFGLQRGLPDEKVRIEASNLCLGVFFLMKNSLKGFRDAELTSPLSEAFHRA